MQNKPNRRKSRAIAMELLYSDTINTRNEEINDAYIDEFIDISDTKETLDRSYITKISSIVVEKDEYLKAVIRNFLKEWTLERISKVNLAILKLAVAEIIFLDDIPERVSLNEALELSKIYSDEEATSFINGVLDKVLKAKQAGTIPKESEVVIPVAPEVLKVQEVQEVSEAPVETLPGIEPQEVRVSQFETSRSLESEVTFEKNFEVEPEEKLASPPHEDRKEQGLADRSVASVKEETSAKAMVEELSEEVPTEGMDIRTQMKLLKLKREEKENSDQ
ncbi:MAG: transcription antitermination factor NusB [Clostridium sp.]|nr:transcription antitermination factor NusB [Clostridium sp.]